MLSAAASGGDYTEITDLFMESVQRSFDFYLDVLGSAAP